MIPIRLSERRRSGLRPEGKSRLRWPQNGRVTGSAIRIQRYVWRPYILLGKSGEPADAELVAARLGDAAESVRAAAADVLAGGGPQALAAAAAVLATALGPTLDAAIAALGGTGGRDAEDGSWPDWRSSLTGRSQGIASGGGYCRTVRSSRHYAWRSTTATGARPTSFSTRLAHWDTSAWSAWSAQR